MPGNIERWHDSTSNNGQSFASLCSSNGEGPARCSKPSGGVGGVGGGERSVTFSVSTTLNAVRARPTCQG